MYTCPVCGYDELRYPPRDFTICPSCYTEFGYEDSNRTYRELTLEWIRKGLPWEAADVMPSPPDWERRKYAQLRNIGLLDYGETAESTHTEIGYGAMQEGVIVEARAGAIRVSIRLFETLTDAARTEHFRLATA